MEKSRKGDLLVIRFADGENLIKGLEAVLTEEKITSGLIVGGVGMIKNAGLSFYVGRGEYETVPVTGAAELCSLSGNISGYEGELVIHMHAVVGTKGGAAMAGHLSSAEVSMTAEVAVLAIQQMLTRKLDPATGLRTLTFE